MSTIINKLAKQATFKNVALLIIGLFITAIFIWYCKLTPSNHRDWQTDVAVLPEATINDNLVAIRNIRNFDYRTELDYTPAFYEKQFDLNKLRGVDLVATYWMGPAIAHIFLSFDFGDNDHVAISIEARREKGEAYSTLKGFFRQYELYYVVADERDLIRLRTNYRRDPPEQVYVYRTHSALNSDKKLFLEYIKKINALKLKPEFYNSLTTNCTNNIWQHNRVNADNLSYSWQILASGYLPKYVYDAGRLDTSVPFSKLEQISHVNARAQAADKSQAFSLLIRTTTYEIQHPSK